MFLLTQLLQLTFSNFDNIHSFLYKNTKSALLFFCWISLSYSVLENMTQPCKAKCVLSLSLL